MNYYNILNSSQDNYIILKHEIESKFPTMNNNKLKKIIDSCIIYKIISINRFFLVKIAFRYILHRKIV